MINYLVVYIYNLTKTTICDLLKLMEKSGKELRKFVNLDTLRGVRVTVRDVLVALCAIALFKSCSYTAEQEEKYKKTLSAFCKMYNPNAQFKYYQTRIGNVSVYFYPYRGPTGLLVENMVKVVVREDSGAPLAKVACKIKK